jgi:hypothetical protein
MLTDAFLYKWGDSAPGSPAAWYQVGGVAFTGSGRWSWCVGEDCFFFARDGGGGIYRWKGGATVVDKVPGAPSDVKYIEYFNHRLIAANTTESGNSWDNRIRWPVNGNHADWTGSGSGFTDLYEPEQEPIRGIKVLSNRLVVFREHSITDLVPSGTLTPVFTSEQRTTNVGSVFPFTIDSNGVMIFFLGNDGNVWAWNGTQLQSIGDAIYRSVEQLIDLVSGQQVYFGKVYPFANEYWLRLSGNNVFVFDFLQGRWMMDYFPDLEAIGDAELHVTPDSWDTMVGSWDSFGARMWHEMRSKASSRLICAKTDNSTVSVGRDVVGNDDGLPITCLIETRDYYIGSPNGNENPLMQKTIEKLLMIYEYNNDVDPFEIGISTDRGRTWNIQNHSPISAGFGLTSWKVTGNVIRFRFKTVSVEPVFRWLSFVEEWVDGGPFSGLGLGMAVSP